jgi:hypothetical protein
VAPAEAVGAQRGVGGRWVVSQSPCPYSAGWERHLSSVASPSCFSFARLLGMLALLLPVCALQLSVA